MKEAFIYIIFIYITKFANTKSQNNETNKQPHNHKTTTP